MSESSTSRDIIGGAYEALVQGDVKGFLGVLDAEIEVSEPACLPYGGTFKGLKDVMGMLGRAGPYLDSGKLVVERLIADGDEVVAMLRIPLRDGSGEAEIAEHWRLRDGKAVELRVYWSDPSIVKADAPA
jgi:ketosteroid isomerase-like protein